MKNTFKKIGFTVIIAVIGLTALLITGCPSDDGNNGKKEEEKEEEEKKLSDPSNYDMAGTYTFTNNDIICTWGFSSDNYECFGGRINGTKTGVWKTKGNDVTFTFNVDSLVVPPETFTVQTDNNKIILTLKNADISNLFILFGFTTPIKTLTLTKINNKYTPINIEMVNIQSGQFMMGSNSSEGGTYEPGSPDFTIPDIEMPKHNVTISKPFKMGKYEITQEQYQFVMGNNPSYFKSNPDAGEIQEKRPVENISWCEAIIFCNKLSIIKGLTPAYSINGKTNPIDWGTPPYYDGYNTIGDIELWNSVIIVEGSTGYRLPTEAQWEYACRAGNTSLFNIGNVMKMDKNENTIIPDNIGWYRKFGESTANIKTHEAGKKLLNTWGLYDMHGNVWEMCWDKYSSSENYYTSSSVTDPLGALSGEYRIIRGGSFGDDFIAMRSACRYYISLYGKKNYTGFRIILPL